MARGKVTVERCDNPECAYKEVLGDDREPATGYHFGKGYWVFGGGGPVPAFYAHQKDCILPALEYVIDPERWEREH